NYGGGTGLRDIGLLESALAQPQASFDGEYLHHDVFEMAAAYLYHIVLNHPFVDGNKRVALASSLVFLEINGILIEASDDELVDLTVAAAMGENPKERIATFFRDAAI
ncbi:MAG: type II toxin-antitoxin system death-on-curing family toxin, partial [Pirellulaceae bacterium]|nr:type II toxin-antitoxin system death-on-curing family toxin [Pirellulaceae bacterium]